MSLWEAVAAQISAATGTRFVLRDRREQGGGCINSTWIVDDGKRRFFVKTNVASRAVMFEAEAAGLRALANAGAVRVPEPVVAGVAEGSAFLVLEHLSLGGGDADEALGRALAAQHRVTMPRYGWDRDNTIGSTPQPNAWSDDWIEFLCEQRIGHQLELAMNDGAAQLRARGEELLDRMPDLFSGYRPEASLLHGDLWGGNKGSTAAGEPVIFDPAVYYGDREADLAMTELFGGFSPRFYAAYRETWPLDEGYRVRKGLYNLYHVLNHFHLFGGGYGLQAENMMGRLLAELR